MKGFQFHAELPAHWKSKSGCKSHSSFTRALLKEWAASGEYCNVMAVPQGPEYRMPSGMVECVSSVFEHDNSAVCGSSASRDYLDKRTVRVDESTARKLHPALFSYLEA